MKRILTIAALTVAAAAGTASAMSQDSTVAIRAINSYVPGVDVSTLSDSTILAALQAIHGSGSESEKAGVVRAIVLDAQ